MINDLGDEDRPPAMIEQVAVCREIVKATTILDIDLYWRISCWPRILLECHARSLQSGAVA